MAAVAPLVAARRSRAGGAGGRASARSCWRCLAIANDADRLFRVTPGELKALPRHMSENAGRARDADRLERVLAHRRRRGLRNRRTSRACTSTPTRGRTRCSWDGRVESLRRPSTYRALPFRFTPSGPHARHRPRRRLRRRRRARRRQPQGHRRRAQSADAEVRPPLRPARRQRLRPARRRSDSKRRPQLHQPHRSEVRRHLPRLRGYVGVGRVGRAVALGELPLHDAGHQGVLRPSDRRRRAGDHAVGHGHPAAGVEHQSRFSASKKPQSGSSPCSRSEERAGAIRRR